MEAEKKVATPLRLNRLLDQPRAQASGAHTNARGAAIDQCPYPLQIGVEHPLGLVIGVTDVVPALVPFAAYLTYECHGKSPSIGACTTLT